ncbi:hypothetical protein PUNSTDRAFT_50093 [Punctularia strigosozonata HHB-11173 SS5]|uniref:uncharacterized protein n=1 Tax=Punctularia strigosozonata (strain HHB-11173) TaxID=741275 RepID=UPI00044177AC|nr:uncharacterized protein PUNSTDRAFT_50093 [Punctularia strigosozonata HHB-11173 SS5]EIN12866.1 hypothetical protein PUNSTDRAFT_50093 [Punctularia strigosozonata HHB-11173 SS5]
MTMESSDIHLHSPIHDLQHDSQFVVDLDDDADTASQRSISLDSPAPSPRHSLARAAPLSPPLKRTFEPHAFELPTDGEPNHLGAPSMSREDSASSTYTEPDLIGASEQTSVISSYPPRSDFTTRESSARESVVSFASGSSGKKARPESMLAELKGPLMLGIALIDFNHLVGPRIEWSKGPLFEEDDVKITEILPFLALPDGAHLTEEDYAYFHLVPTTSPNPTTVFGISCNRQIAAKSLLVKGEDVTRTTVQKAVAVFASKPIFGLLRDRLGVITRALFDQRDFTDLGILADFYESLEMSMRSQLTESGLYMGTSLRELVHAFRQRTLVILKTLILQKKIMFSGHPVERLCTHQYSLISLIPGLLQSLEDCGSPPLNTRAPTLMQASSLKTSDRKSMMAYLGLPLDLFGKDAFFQPYIPLQQMDMMKDTPSWLCGSTNTIVTNSKEVDLLVNLETGALEFRNPGLERLVALTAADRKWMDEIVRDVNEGWDNADPARPTRMLFKGSDDYLRTKFEEYVFAALSSIKYADFLAKGDGSGVVIAGGSGGDTRSAEDFNLAWIAEFRRTHAYEIWNRITDPVLFDIVEPRHPCGEKPSLAADIGLRLSEGIQELKLDQQLAPAREVVSRTISAGSTGFFRAVEGVRGRWAARAASGASPSPTPASSSPNVSPTPDKHLSTSTFDKLDADTISVKSSASSAKENPAEAQRRLGVAATETKAAVSSWGVGIGSFLSTRFSRVAPTLAVPSASPSSNTPAAAPEVAPIGSTALAPDEEALFQPRDLDAERADSNSMRSDQGRVASNRDSITSNRTSRSSMRESLSSRLEAALTSSATKRDSAASESERSLGEEPEREDVGETHGQSMEKAVPQASILTELKDDTTSRSTPMADPLHEREVQDGTAVHVGFAV